jgi:hypothetical protein
MPAEVSVLRTAPPRLRAGGGALNARPAFVSVLSHDISSFLYYGQYTAGCATKQDPFSGILYRILRKVQSTTRCGALPRTPIKYQQR